MLEVPVCARQEYESDEPISCSMQVDIADPRDTIVKIRGVPSSKALNGLTVTKGTNSTGRNVLRVANRRKACCAEM